MKWFVLEGVLKIMCFEPSYHWQGRLPLDQDAQSTIQLVLEHCQKWGVHNFSRQPDPVSHQPYNKEFLLCT